MIESVVMISIALGYLFGACLLIKSLCDLQRRLKNYEWDGFM